jgi:hypothetical protein
MDYRKVEIRIPRTSLPKPSSRWLPSPGNVVFTLLLVGALFWAQSAGALSALVPNQQTTSTSTVPYQGRLADTSGSPLTGSYPMVFRLYDASAGGASLWEESWVGSNSVAVNDGLFNVMLGSITPISQDVFTGADSLWLGISVSSDDEMSPRVQLGTVPYAVQAMTVPDASVTTAKIAAGAVTQDKLAADVDILPEGTVLMWHGSLDNLPSGWQLCDGSSNTPNLTDRFVVGAGGAYAMDDQGGTASVILTFDQMPSHTHPASASTNGGIEFSRSDRHGGGIYYGNGTIYYDNNSTMGSHTHTITVQNTGGGQAHENRPPFWALAFICKTSTP